MMVAFILLCVGFEREKILKKPMQDIIIGFLADKLITQLFSLNPSSSSS